jgi:hypothetical protein
MAQKSEAEFTEIGRVKVSPTTNIVLSSVERIGEGIVGININGYIVSARYTGPTKGVFVPNDKISEFVKLINSLGG